VRGYWPRQLSSEERLRRIPLSRRSHIIGFQPLPTGTVEHESALERDFVVLSTFLDPHAVITAQPITITFQVGAVTRLALKRLHEEGRSHVDESAIFRTIETMRRIADEAVTATKTIRRQQERRLRVIQGGRTDASVAVVAEAPGRDVEDQDHDNSTAHIRMLPFEEWS
jgi:hypothetical protein